MNRIISSIVILLTLVFLDGCVYYVIVNDKDGTIVQIKNKLKPNWKE